MADSDDDDELGSADAANKDANEFLDSFGKMIRSLIAGGDIEQRTKELFIKPVKYNDKLPRAISSLITDEVYDDLSAYYSRNGKVTYTVVEIMPVRRVSHTALHKLRDAYRSNIIDITIDIELGAFTVLLVHHRDQQQHKTPALLAYDEKANEKRFSKRIVETTDWITDEDIMQSPVLYEAIEKSTKMLLNCQKTMPLISLEIKESSKYHAVVSYQGLTRIEFSFLHRLEKLLLQKIDLQYAIYNNNNGDDDVAMDVKFILTTSQPDAAETTTSSNQKKRTKRY